MVSTTARICPTRGWWRRGSRMKIGTCTRTSIRLSCRATSRPLSPLSKGGALRPDAPRQDRIYPVSGLPPVGLCGAAASMLSECGTEVDTVRAEDDGATGRRAWGRGVGGAQREGLPVQTHGQAREGLRAAATAEADDCRARRGAGEAVQCTGLLHEERAADAAPAVSAAGPADRVRGGGRQRQTSRAAAPEAHRPDALELVGRPRHPPIALPLLTQEARSARAA